MSTQLNSALLAFSRVGPLASSGCASVNLAACSGSQPGSACVSVFQALPQSDRQVTRCQLVVSTFLPVGLPCSSSFSWAGHMVSQTRAPTQFGTGLITWHPACSATRQRKGVAAALAEKKIAILQRGLEFHPGSDQLLLALLNEVRCFVPLPQRLPGRGSSVLLRVVPLWQPSADEGKGQGSVSCFAACVKSLGTLDFPQAHTDCLWPPTLRCAALQCPGPAVDRRDNIVLSGFVICQPDFRTCCHLGSESTCDQCRESWCCCLDCGSCPGSPGLCQAMLRRIIEASPQLGTRLCPFPLA